MRHYILVILPPNGTKQIFDPKCHGHTEISSETGRTHLRFRDKNDSIVLDCVVGLGHSYALSWKDIPDEHPNGSSAG